MNDVWLVEVIAGDRRSPYLVFEDADAIRSHFPQCKFTMFDSDVVEFESNYFKYYASPWPVHRENTK